ncbi:MAG TPA: isoprenylcysteine carboxylmethyltransferase family protein [Ktedonobacterales bacterium]|jgi:protein-S-isoprenylcysteine O-methyltransferase Ste14
MQPLFIHQPLLLGVLVTSLLIWRGMETGLDIRSHKRLRAGAQRQDKGTLAILFILIALGVVLGALLAFIVPATAVASSRAIFFWLGILLIYTGIAFRLYAIHTLGAYFTTAVAIAPQQTVISAGPYQLIRHPAYTGFLITLFGYGLCLTNWLSLLVMMGCALVAFIYRIRVEERVLQERLGQPYQEYMRRTKRLIPFVL